MKKTENQSIIKKNREDLIQQKVKSKAKSQDKFNLT